jgi:dTDP-4-dehydrorhamnose reductase
VSGTRSLAEFFVNHLSAGKAVRGFTDVTFCPMLVNDLARVLIRMLEKGLHGLYHAVGPEPMSKYEFGVRIARQFGFDEHLIGADSVEHAGLTARRAHNLNLSIHRLSTALGAALPSFSTGLLEFYTQYQQGYPQKVRSYQQVPMETGQDGTCGRSVRPAGGE